ncbi:MAG TPA: hypothetical protein VFT81_01950 [Dermatophilaceae bacterium]|nr:hypothetical protein [Dermatophilaceae bacterium]
MIDRPNFKFSRRGYEPAEVDAFIESLNRTAQAAKKDASERSVDLTRLNATVTDLRAQLGQQSKVMAELKKSAAAPAQDFAALGERIGQILQLAESEAADVRSGAQADADSIRERATKSAEELKASTTAYAADARARADEEAARIISQAKREAQQLIVEAQGVASAYRTEAAAEVEAHRAKVSAATAELETKLSQRREQAAAEFAARRDAEESTLREIVSRAQQIQERAEREGAEARERAQSRLSSAMAEADQVIAEAREHAARIREDSERELAAATAQRDNINSQLANVRQMLASFGMGSVEVPEDVTAGPETAPAPAGEAKRNEEKHHAARAEDAAPEQGDESPEEDAGTSGDDAEGAQRTVNGQPVRAGQPTDQN